MARSISASVGSGGVNRKDDSATVQELLNQVPPDRGGPVPPLVVDGLPWQKTQAAIRQFQRVHVGFRWPDGRVDPGGRTLAGLNEFDEPPEVAERLEPGPVFLV